MFEQRSEVVEHIHLMPCMGADAPGEDAAVDAYRMVARGSSLFLFLDDISEILR
jgi:hypothetical protein